MGYYADTQLDFTALHDLNQATQHWHTDRTRTHAISVCPG